jgi:MFS family permease
VDAAADRHEEQAALQRRTLRILFVAQVLAGGGLAAGITVGALLAEDMLGSTGAAGLPTALFTLGAAGAAIQVGRISQRSGRRPGLATGYAVGALGAAGVVGAAALDSAALLFVSLFLYGSGTATNLQARYAGADLAAAERRATSVSIVLIATTVGAVLGPNLVEPTGHLAEAVGVRELAGPFILAAGAYAVAAAVVVVCLRPDPLIVAGRMALAAGSGRREAEARQGDPMALRVAAAAMILTQLVMVAIMTMTPIHMRDHGHGIGAAGFVISVHVAAMFLPSLVTGMLVDRFGRRPILVAGTATLLAAGVLAALSPPESMVALTIALALLGLGWNFGLVAGTAMVTDAAPFENRARTQGTVDLTVALSGASGGMASGFVVAAAGYSALSLAGGFLALALLPLLFVERSRATSISAASSGLR